MENELSIFTVSYVRFTNAAAHAHYKNKAEIMILIIDVPTFKLQYVHILIYLRSIVV